MKENTSLGGYPRRKEQVITQKGADEVLLFNMEDGSYYALNEVGNRIWELCDGTHGMAEMVCVLAKEYNAPAEIIDGHPGSAWGSAKQGTYSRVQNGSSGY